MRQLDQLENGQCTYTLYRTSPEADATSLARNAFYEQCALFIIVGGDGTVNEVVNGIAGTDPGLTTSVALAVMPHGSGNDFFHPVPSQKNLQDYR